MILPWAERIMLGRGGASAQCMIRYPVDDGSIACPPDLLNGHRSVINFRPCLPDLHRQIRTGGRPTRLERCARTLPHSEVGMHSSHRVDATDPDLFVASARPTVMDFMVT